MAILNQEKGQWKKGQSGNPDGRPPIVKELKSFLQEKLSEIDPLQPEKTNLEAISWKTLSDGTEGQSEGNRIDFQLCLWKA